ncbi:GNAT family N-acetyltransferase [Paucibacter sp. KCTC 42545]|uniref:GNAT family N-acetyltransferase n=1 Tax=Paucibacter sp. KCTC 42545 TaxID=1768242 RepID=UPI000733BA55|nr:GNAT family N-acetyltransferase [Paucibacter sp. KCTC 42545]ALT79050.1 hypothetical protein AT984_19515 [Paucibacter sp. KCTC 42545]
MIANELVRRIRALSGRKVVKNLPEITVATTSNFYKAFTSPCPEIKATMRNRHGELVGAATYAVSPLADRTYLFDILISPAHRRQGYGIAMLKYLAITHGHPITTVKELGSARDFWAAARSPAVEGITLTETLSESELPAEKQRWAVAKKAEIELLEKAITERLVVGREPWLTATSRGLSQKERTPEVRNSDLQGCAP